MHKGYYNTSAIGPMAAYAAHTTNQNTHLLTAQKQNKSHTKEPTFRKMEVKEKRSQENGPKAQKDKTESKRTGQKNKRGDIEKWDQTVSPEIQTGGRHQKYPASRR